MNPEQDQPPVIPEQPQQPTPVQPTAPEATTTNPVMMSSPAANPMAPQNTAPVKNPGENLAIASIILAFFLPLLGLVVAIIAYMKSKKVGATNTLAIISVVVNTILIVVSVLILILFFSAFRTQVSDVAVDTGEIINQGQEDFAANVVVGKPLADLKWNDLYTSSDSSWEIINEEDGTGQFQQVTSKCVVTFDQPAGLIAAGVTSSQQVAEDYAELLSSESAQYITQEDNRLIINFSQPEGLIIPFETYTIKDTNSKPVGLVSSFVQDDFGLIVSGVCPPNSTSGLQTTVRSFMQSKTATLIYQ